MTFASLMASSSDVWGGIMIGGFLLGGQTCTLQWPAPALGVNMSNPYPWYLAKFFGIGLALRHKIGCSTVAATRAYGSDLLGEDREMGVGGA